MNEMLLNILSVVVTAVIIPLITYGGLKLTAFLRDKIKNENLRKYLEFATEAVAISVKSTMQTYVDGLKKTGNFTEEAHKEAFNMAKTQALSIITEEGKEALTMMYGDFDKWINAEIEATVNQLKNG